MDVLLAQHAEGDDAALMMTGCHYDYRAQVWVDGHDHAHCTSDTGALMFCGADHASCVGILADSVGIRCGEVSA